MDKNYGKQHFSEGVITLLKNLSCNSTVWQNFRVTVYKTQCRNYVNSLSSIFGKNFVKVAVLLNKLLKSWFDEIFFWWERISRFFHTVCPDTTKSFSFLRFFRENKVSENANLLISRISFQQFAIVNFCYFHTFIEYHFPRMQKKCPHFFTLTPHFRALFCRRNDANKCSLSLVDAKNLISPSL